MATIALHKEMEDEVTGAVSDYHVLATYYVDVLNNYSQFTFATYVSERAYLAGKQPVGRSITIQANQAPPADKDIAQWAYEIASAPAAEGEPNPSALAGAEPITE